MLKSLSIKNFAIIDNIELSFYSGMTVLTGATGAGKSLIIDSINLLLGARADLDMIRYGEEKAIIRGEFDLNDELKKSLEEMSIKENSLIIERIISKKGQIKVNGINVTLAELNKLTKKLADVHTQEDTYKLINPDTYLSLIDSFEQIDKTSYLESLFSYSEQLKKYNQIINKNKSLNEKLDLLNFQYQEISSYNLKENELDELIVMEDKLKNFDKIYKGLNLCYQGLVNEYFSVDNIYDASNQLKDILDYDPKYKEFNERLNNAYYEIDDVASSLKQMINILDFDPIELEKISSRIYDLKTLEKKYNKSVNEIIKYFDEIKYEIDLQTNYDELLKDNLSLLEKKYNKVLEEALKLSEKRKKSAKKIEKALLEECNELDLHNVEFKIQIDNVNTNMLVNSFSEDGIDNVDFLISMNLGEPMKSLHKVASGGELSRIMLGLKDILAKFNGISLMVFDEIDTGISGVTSLKIAKKIKSISKYTQVLSITHQAQVAAIADYQLNVNKEVNDGRTKTIVKYLDESERIKEIAIMLSGSLSIASLEGAKELLEL